MKTIKDYQPIIAATILALSFLLYGHGQQFQLIQLSGGRFFQVNKYTGQIVQVCQLEPAHCYKWNGVMLEDKDDFYGEYLSKRMKEEELKD